MSMKVPTWLRVLIPVALIFTWLAVAGIGGPYFGRIDEVSSNDPTAYLPTTAEATVVQERLAPVGDVRRDEAEPQVVAHPVVGEGPVVEALLVVQIQQVVHRASPLPPGACAA